MIRIKKKMIAIIMAICCFCVTEFPMQVTAAESDNPYVIINGTEIIREGENYYNEETGEYFYWGKERGVDKTFSFKIRYSVTSSSFIVNGTSVKIQSSAYVTSDIEDAFGYEGFQYNIYLDGLYSRKLQFEVEGVESGTIAGLKKGGSYKVTISTQGTLPAYYYLEGKGSVTSYN